MAYSGDALLVVDRLAVPPKAEGHDSDPWPTAPLGIFGRFWRFRVTVHTVRIVGLAV